MNVRGKTRHFLNPSNFGLVASILIYSQIGLAAPYQFTEHLYGFFYVVLPLFILYTGSLLNGKLTKRMPLILAWVGAFILQAVVRHYLFGSRLPSSLAPLSGVPFVIFTFYMVTDPATSPSSTRGQIVFGAALGATYGILMAFHQAFGLIVALMIVCVCRGIMLYAFEHGYLPKLRAFLDGQPSPAAGSVPGDVARGHADGTLAAGAQTPAIPRAVPAVGAE